MYITTHTMITAPQSGVETRHVIVDGVYKNVADATAALGPEAADSEAHWTTLRGLGKRILSAMPAAGLRGAPRVGERVALTNTATIPHFIRPLR